MLIFGHIASLDLTFVSTCSLTLDTTSPATVHSATTMAISGLRVGSTVRTQCLMTWSATQNVADVINVSGHRLSTSEIESALILHDGVAEAAVIGATDELTGQSVHAFVTLKPYVIIHNIALSHTDDFSSEFEHDSEAGLVKELSVQVRNTIGPFAAPKKIYVVPDLPKTRSGKVRKLLILGCH